MGCVNLFAGAVFMSVGVKGREVVSLGLEADAAEQGGAKGLEGFGYYALIALLTGFAMMTLQTTLIRVGVLAMGPSQFTFSMVVAVFVLAIALGSFLVSAFSRIPPWVIVANQWGIPLFFLLLYPQIEDSPYWMLLVRVLFRDTNAGFYGYYFGALVVILALIGPAVILSGASLPLLFHHMRREVTHLGDLAGYLYSWNTVGSLLGALVGGYALFFWLDLHEVYRVAIVALLVAAAILSVRVYGRPAISAAILLPFLAAVFLLPSWRPELLYSGLFRKSVADRLMNAGPLYVGHERFTRPFGGRHAPEILFHVDEPTSSVVVREHKRPDGSFTRSIASQGKTDGDTARDYGTTGLLALVPSLLAEKAERAFVIGWGLGSTAGELGSFDSIQKIDVAEISPGIVQAAPYFDFATENASTNPKINLLPVDAYRALMRSTGSYDVIISEPSQVWAAGVEMLFTREFLEATKSRLSPGGVYCQFMHRYEVDDESIALVMRTYASVYDHVAVWHDVNQSLMLLGFKDPKLATDHFRMEQRAARPDFKAAMERYGIPNFPALLAYELWPLDVLGALDLSGPVQSLYHPRLNDIAGRAFFRGEQADLPFTGYGEPAKIGARNSLVRRYASRFRKGLPASERAQTIVEACGALGPRCDSMVAEWMSEKPEDRAVLDRLIDYVGTLPAGLSRERLEDLGRLFRASPEELRATEPGRATRASSDFVRYYHHAAPFDPEILLDLWSSCRESRLSHETCVEAVERAGSDPRGLSFEERVAECETVSKVGHECQQGMGAARALVERGVLPKSNAPRLAGH
jgi:spermidine synthase